MEEGVGKKSTIRVCRTIGDPPPYPPPPPPAVGRRRPEEEEEGGVDTPDRITYYRHRRYLIASTTFILYIPIFAP